MKTFNWKIYAQDDRRVWYDRHARTWFMQTVDVAGNQHPDTEAETDARRGVAMRWLKTGKTTEVIKGTHGFLFEFKLKTQNLVFIRYQAGDREFRTQNEIPIWLWSREDMPQRIRQHLRAYAGAGERVVQHAIKMVLP